MTCEVSRQGETKPRAARAWPRSRACLLTLADWWPWKLLPAPAVYNLGGPEHFSWPQVQTQEGMGRGGDSEILNTLEGPSHPHSLSPRSLENLQL